MIGQLPLLTAIHVHRSFMMKKYQTFMNARLYIKKKNNRG